MSDQPTLRDTVEEAARSHAFYRVAGAADVWRCTCNWWETRSLHGDPWEAHLTDALTTAVQPWLDGQAWADLTAERDALTALTAECSCATTYATYEGPEPDCPVHGAVRAFNEASAENARLRAALAAANAENERLRHERAEFEADAELLEAKAARQGAALAKANAREQAVRELHKNDTSGDAAPADPGMCEVCMYEWPCPTMKALTNAS